MEFEENNEEFEGNRTSNLKEKQREFFTRARNESFILFIYYKNLTITKCLMGDY
jgi:hypothetical protein